MKILVMNLLRAGDLLLSSPVLKGLKRKYPGAKIHVLTNRVNSPIAPLFGMVDRFFYFERDLIQRSLGETERSIFEGFDRIQELVSELNCESYDEVINLTHNRLSGHLAALIDCKTKTGLVLLPDGRAVFGSPWFRYLNDRGLDRGGEIFHFTDIFFYGSGLAGNRRAHALTETAKGRSELEGFGSGFGEKAVVVQCFTSDAKKNWNLNSFRQAISTLCRLRAGTQIVVLGAPSEAAQLNPMVEELKTEGADVRLAVLSFEGAYSLLKRADVVICPDTSIKHLAAAAGTRVIELSLGSSDFRRTGVYLEQSLILQSDIDCAPCPHGRACPFEDHPCAKNISPELVALTAKCVLDRDHETLRMIAHEYRGETRVYEVSFGATGDWSAVSLAEEFSGESLARWVDRSCWRILLNRNLDQRIVPYGSEALNIQRLLSKEFPERNQTEWNPLIEGMEGDLVRVEKSLSELMVTLSVAVRQYETPEVWDEFIDQVLTISERPHLSLVEEKYARSLARIAESNGWGSFARVRRVKETLSELHRRALIELKLIRSLRTGLAEVHR